MKLGESRRTDNQKKSCSRQDSVISRIFLFFSRNSVIFSLFFHKSTQTPTLTLRFLCSLYLGHDKSSIKSSTILCQLRLVSLGYVFMSIIHSPFFVLYNEHVFGYTVDYSSLYALKCPTAQQTALFFFFSICAKKSCSSFSAL